MELKEEDNKTYKRIIGIRKIFFNPKEDYLSSLGFDRICRKKDKFTCCILILNRFPKNFANSGLNIDVQV